MSSKAEKIAEMIKMQKEFIAYEHANGVEPKDYFTPEAGHKLDGYRDKYQEISASVAEMAHGEAGSKEFF